jgi:tetratricopeptide (TPR) repeat protein
MRAQFACLALVFCLAWPGIAAAQFWGSQPPGRAVSNMGFVEIQSRDWAQCTGVEQVQPQRVLSACGRIISERVSREVTAAAHYYRSVVYRQLDDEQRANADMARAAQLLSELVLSEPEDPIHLNNLIFLRFEMRDFAGAAADYAGLASRRPNDAELRLNQGYFLFRAGDYAGAISAFDAAALIAPENAQIQSGRCEARAAANLDLDVAELACADAIRLSGQSSATLFSRGFLRFAQGRLEEAQIDFESAGKQDNTNPFAAYGFAVANLRLGRFEEQSRAILADVSSAVPDVEMYAQAGLRP